jgi:flagellar biosynthesis chaperone FliJ
MAGAITIENADSFLSELAVKILAHEKRLNHEQLATAAARWTHAKERLEKWQAMRGTQAARLAEIQFREAIGLVQKIVWEVQR